MEGKGREEGRRGEQRWVAMLIRRILVICGDHSAQKCDKTCFNGYEICVVFVIKMGMHTPESHDYHVTVTVLYKLGAGIHSFILSNSMGISVCSPCSFI